MHSVEDGVLYVEPQTGKGIGKLFGTNGLKNLDTGTYTSNVAASYVPQPTAAPQIIGNPTPTVRTLPAKVVKTTLPPQYKTNTLPPKVVRVNLPPVGPVGGAVTTTTTTTSTLPQEYAY